MKMLNFVASVKYTSLENLYKYGIRPLQSTYLVSIQPILQECMQVGIWVNSLSHYYNYKGAII